MRGTSRLVCVVAIAAAGCEDAPVTAIAIDQPIINGTLDTTHQAVVAVVNTSQGFACTGTIIAVDGLDGYVLTAAHCAPAEYVISGNDYSAPTALSYPVAQQDIDPQYNDGDPTAGHDFSVVRFTGATALTPVIPAMTPAEDALAVGTPLTQVGYGVTESDPNNSQRRRFDGTVSDLAPLLVQFDATAGGTCSGDSGGPALSSGPERVAGVASFGDINCNTFGVAGRVSAVYNSFIAPILTGTPAVDAAPGMDAQPRDDAGGGPDAGGGNPDDGDGGGCCDTRGDRGGAGAIVLALWVGAVLARRRART